MTFFLRPKSGTILVLSRFPLSTVSPHSTCPQTETEIIKTVMRIQAKSNLSYRNYVIATGGSAAYSHAAILHLKKNGTIIFLNVDLPTLESRIHNFSTRGLAKRPEQSLADLFKERYELYTTYADFTVDCNELNQEEVCERIINRTGALNQ